MKNLSPAIAAAVGALSLGVAPAFELEVGRAFPRVPLPVAGGEERTLSIVDFQGEKLMLHLFASW